MIVGNLSDDHYLVSLVYFEIEDCGFIVVIDTYPDIPTNLAKVLMKNEHKRSTHHMRLIKIRCGSLLRPYF